MHFERVHAQSLIVNGKLIVVGGEVFGRTEGVAVDKVPEIGSKSVQRDKSSIEEYDFELQRWDVLCSLPTVLWQHSVCCVHRAYAFGGIKTATATTSSSHDTFCNGAATELFIGGGYATMRRHFVADCMVYNTATDKLESIAPMKAARSCATAICFDFSVNDHGGGGGVGAENGVYVIGGHSMGDGPPSAKCVEVYDLGTRQWAEAEPLLFDHGFYPAVWVQNLLDFTQKRSKEEKERLKRINRISKNVRSVDPQPVFTIFVAGNGCFGDGACSVEYLDPESRKWKALKEEIGDIQIASLQSRKQEVFRARKFTPYSIRDDVLAQFQKQQDELQKYAIMDEL